MEKTTPHAEAADAFQALSDPKRLRILELLREGERCVCELTDALGVGQSLLSFHLKTLRDAGLVRGRRDGRWVHYSLDRQALHDVRGRLGHLLGAAESSGSGPDARRDAGGWEAVGARRCC